MILKDTAYLLRYAKTLLHRAKAHMQVQNLVESDFFIFLHGVSQVPHWFLAQVQSMWPLLSLWVFCLTKRKDRSLAWFVSHHPTVLIMIWNTHDNNLFSSSNRHKIKTGMKTFASCAIFLLRKWEKYISKIQLVKKNPQKIFYIFTNYFTEFLLCSSIPLWKIWMDGITFLRL